MGLCGLGGGMGCEGIGVGWGGVTVDHPPRTLRRIRAGASRGPRRTARGPRAHHAHHLPCVCRLAAPLPPFSSRLCAPCIQPHVNVAKRTGLGGEGVGVWGGGARGTCARGAFSMTIGRGRAAAKWYKNEKTARPAVVMRCGAQRTRTTQNSHTETDADRTRLSTLMPQACEKCDVHRQRQSIIGPAVIFKKHPAPRWPTHARPCANHSSTTAAPRIPPAHPRPHTPSPHHRPTARTSQCQPTPVPRMPCQRAQRALCSARGPAPTPSHGDDIKQLARASSQGARPNPKTRKTPRG